MWTFVLFWGMYVFQLLNSCTTLRGLCLSLFLYFLLILWLQYVFNRTLTIVYCTFPSSYFSILYLVDFSVAWYSHLAQCNLKSHKDLDQLHFLLILSHWRVCGHSALSGHSGNTTTVVIVLLLMSDIYIIVLSLTRVVIVKWYVVIVSF